MEKEEKQYIKFGFVEYTLITICVLFISIAILGLFVEMDIYANPYQRDCYMLLEQKDKLILIVYYKDNAIVRYVMEYEVEDGLVNEVKMQFNYTSVASACVALKSEMAGNDKYVRKLNVVRVKKSIPYEQRPTKKEVIAKLLKRYEQFEPIIMKELIYNNGQ